MSFKQNMPPGKSDLDDTKNLILFFILSAIIYIALDSFILRPARLAQEQVKKEQRAEIAQNAAVNDPVLVVRDVNEVLQESPRVDIHNDVLMGSVATVGNRLDDIRLSNYYETLEKKKHVRLFAPPGTESPQYAEVGWLSTDGDIKLPGKDTKWTRERSKEGEILLSWDNGQGLLFKKKILLDDKFLFSIDQTVENKTGKAVTLYPYGLVARHGVPKDLQARAVLHEGPIGYLGHHLVEYKYTALATEKEFSDTANMGWIGITEKYWFSGVIPEQGEAYKYRFAYKERPSNPTKGIYQTDITGQPHVIAAGETGKSTISVFVGVKKIDVLEEYEAQLGMPHFDLVIDFGWLYFLTRPLHYVLGVLYGFSGNFGVAIILLTILVRGSVFPLANASFKSFARMKQISPQMTELREKYADDKARLQEEIVKLYEKEKVNPMVGCLPIIVQIPVFFALYKVIYIAIEMRHAPFFGWIQDLSAQDPTSFLNLFGLLPYEAPDFLRIGAWSCLMLVFLLIQKKMNPPPQDPIQKQMMTFFPFFITYILSSFPSGLVIYWTCGNILSVLQQYIIMTRMGVPVYLFNRSKYDELLEKQIDEGPAVHPGLEMISEEVEEALFGSEEGEKGAAKPVSAPKPKKKKKKK